MRKKNTKSLINTSVEWINQKRKMLIFFILFVYLYTAIHESIHYGATKLLGYSATIQWGVFSFTMELKDSSGISVSQIFLINMMPYVFDVLLLLVMYVAYLFIKKKEVLAKIIVFPALDILFNFLMIFKVQLFGGVDDFLNVLRLGTVVNNVPIITFFIAGLLITTLLLCRPFIGSIAELLRFDKK